VLALTSTLGILDKARLKVVADRGYYSGPEIRACDLGNISAYVAEAALLERITMDSSGVDKLKKVAGQLVGLYEEMSLLSKKNPNYAVNKFKLKFINRQLGESNEFLSQKYRPFDDFDIFSEDDVPQNSDVVFILSQYLQCMEKLRGDNVIIRNGTWYWHVEGGENDKSDEHGYTLIRSTKPKHLRD
jgi:hypothetical protein